MRPRRLVLCLSFLAVSALVVPSALASAPRHSTAHMLASAPVCGPDPTPVKADGTLWTCTFDDEFDGTSLDTSKWLVLTTKKNGVKAGSGCFVDSSNNVGESDGSLHLTVRAETAPVLCRSPKGAFYTYVTAGQVTTSGNFAQTYGRFSVRARMPAAAAGGIHSALWLWPQDPIGTQLIGEIDLAEVYSALNDRAIPYLHYLLDKTTVDLATNTNVFTNNYCMINDVTQYHDYTVEWTPSTITIIYDGQTCLIDNLLTLGPSPFQQRYFLTLTESLGVGANAPTLRTPLPSTMDIDWVRIWR